LDGLQRAYFEGGRISIQNGGDAPRLMTNGDRDIIPTFSDDGEKLMFLRGLVPRDLYSMGMEKHRYA